MKVLARDGAVRELLQQIAAFWMRGGAPEFAYEWMNTAGVVALKKPKGGLRPISILSAWRR
eukprot:5157992-Prorocentrum_lima.AAC.1